MKLYGISSKCGKSPYQGCAFVEANSPKEAIQKFHDHYNGNTIDDEIKYRAYLTELPRLYWEMADYCRLPYIPA